MAGRTNSIHRVHPLVRRACGAEALLLSHVNVENVTAMQGQQKN
jgi:hypothetical protein